MGWFDRCCSVKAVKGRCAFIGSLMLGKGGKQRWHSPVHWQLKLLCRQLSLWARTWSSGLCVLSTGWWSWWKGVRSLRSWLSVEDRGALGGGGLRDTNIKRSEKEKPSSVHPKRKQCVCKRTWKMHSPESQERKWSDEQRGVNKGLTWKEQKVTSLDHPKQWASPLDKNFVHTERKLNVSVSLRIHLQWRHGWSSLSLGARSNRGLLFTLQEMAF